MNFIARYRTAIASIMIVIAAFVAYSIFFAKPEEPGLSKEAVAGENRQVDQDLLTLLLTLRSIKLDDSLFDDPRFASLKDFSRELAPEPVGRVNPFAPLSP